MIGARGFALWAALLAGAGCMPATMGTARPMPPGHTEYGAGLTVNSARWEGGAAPAPLLAAGVRYGVADRVDVGGQIWTFPVRALAVFGFLADTRVLVGEDVRWLGGADVSLSPGAGVQVVSSGGAYGHQVLASLACLVGWDLGERFHLVAGPRVMNATLISEGANTIQMPMFGSSLGLAWHTSRTFSIMLDTSLLYTPVTVSGRDGGANLSHLTLGVTWRR